MEVGAKGCSCSPKEEKVTTEGDMPRDGKKGKNRQGNLSTSSDITLQNFADCSMPQACSRVRKSVIGATAVAIGKSSGVKGMEAQESEDQEDWFDKDLDSFVVPNKVQEEEDLAASEIAAERAERLRRAKDKKVNDKEGLVYPPDLWFHLSNFIDPVEVGRFAAVCSGSYAVTKTAAFWRQLYHRYYKEVKKKRDVLPKHLRPAGMEKLNGLRARVISALFHIYSPFVTRIKSTGPMDVTPHDLTGYRCLLAWHQPGTKGWQFCFKLQKPSLFTRKSSPLDLHNGYMDIFYNLEEDCCILQINCCHFSAVPPVMGLLLKQVYMTLSVGFRHHRLRLHFDTTVSSGTNSLTSVSDKVAILDDIIGIKILQWWDPAYPFIP